MKKALTVFLVITLIVSCNLCASAAETKTVNLGNTVVNYNDWIIEKINKDTQWQLDEYQGNSTNLIIPRTIDNLLVVAFGNHCFSNNTKIKSVETYPPLWTIGDYAFIDCKSLEYFKLNYALKTIGAGAFCGTTSLKSINLQDTVVTEISAYAFSRSGLEYAELPSTCTKIGNYAFAQCYSMRFILIPDSVTEISDNAFDECDDFSIICNSTSYAAQYAQSKGIRCLDLNNPILGDSNADGDVDIMDATYIQKYKIGAQGYDLTEYQRRCADVNRDGKVTVRDATLIQMKLAKYDVDF